VLRDRRRRGRVKIIQAPFTLAEIVSRAKKILREVNKMSTKEIIYILNNVIKGEVS